MVSSVKFAVPKLKPIHRTWRDTTRFGMVSFEKLITFENFILDPVRGVDSFLNVRGEAAAPPRVKMTHVSFPIGHD